jgi:hypothetical protein
MRAQREVVVLVPRESRQVEHDNEMHAALVQAAEREQVLKLAAVRRLRAFTFLVKPSEDLVALAAAVFLLARLRASSTTHPPYRAAAPIITCSMSSVLTARRHIDIGRAEAFGST